MFLIGPEYTNDGESVLAVRQVASYGAVSLHQAACTGSDASAGVTEVSYSLGLILASARG